MKQTIKYMIGVLLCLSSHLSTWAQDYDPDSNPPEPYQYNKITVKAEPAEAASWLGGQGYYKEGSVIRLECGSRGSSYIFSHWEKDGEVFSSEQYVNYTTDNNAHTFTAHFTYAPTSPDEPLLNDNRIYLTAEPLTACSFNQQSGQRFAYDEWIYLEAYANSGYSFLGWYKDGVKQSESLSFSFNMPEGDVRLTAKFEYNPFNPAEPEGDGTQSNVQTTPTGDANGDGVVDVADAVRIINLCLSNEYDAKADVNADGEVDVADAVAVINICMKAE